MLFGRIPAFSSCRSPTLLLVFVLSSAHTGCHSNTHTHTHRPTTRCYKTERTPATAAAPRAETFDFKGESCLRYDPDPGAPPAFSFFCCQPSISRSLNVVPAKRKVAVCITGRLDFLPITADNLRRNVFEALGPEIEVDVDIFVYSYTQTYCQNGVCSGRSDRNRRYLQLLNPVDVIMEPQKERLDESGFRYCSQWQRTGVKACAETQVQIIYDLYRANMMRKRREEALGFSYDWVIRLRADVLFTQKVPPLSTYPTDRLTVPTFHNDRPACHPCLNDRFAIGPSHVMDVLMDQYARDSRTRQRCHFTEFSLYIYLQEQGLEEWVCHFFTISELCCPRPFPPDTDSNFHTGGR